MSLNNLCEAFIVVRRKKKAKRTFQDEKMLTTGRRFHFRQFFLSLELNQELIKVIKYLGRSTRWSSDLFE